MNYSRKQLYALGEPFGESATRLKPGGRVYGGGGSPSTPDKTTQVTDLPDWAKGYAKDTLAKTSALTDISQNPYQTYGGERIAGFQPMQQQSFEGAANMQPSQQLGLGTSLAGAAGLGALGTNYQTGQFSNQFQDPGQYQPGQFSMMQAQAPSLQNYQMGPAERVRTQSFNQPGSAEAYMSPYMQNVVDIQKREAQRQSGIQGTQQQAQAVGAGAFGGSRDSIMRAERERNLGQQMGDIQATGQQAAFQNAQQQFNAEQQARLQAQQANQQAGLTVGGQNLQSRLGVQQLGAGQNLQSQLANQQAFQQAQQAAEQSRQFGSGQGLQAANLGAQYGQAAQQLGEQSRQYGAGLGMQGLQTALQSAGQLGQLGQTQYGQETGIIGLQNQLGTQQQQQAQRPLDMAYQDFINQQNYPYKQLGFMSDMIRGLPLGQQSTQSVYQAPPSALQTVGALGMGAYGLSKMAGGGIVAFGGGGDTDVTDSPMDDPTEMAQAVSKLSDEQLQQIIQQPSSAAELQAAKMELATRASESRGLASAYNMMPEQAPTTQATPQAPMMQAAKGGIMHFKQAGQVGDGEAEEDEDQVAALDPSQLFSGNYSPGNQANFDMFNKEILESMKNVRNYQPSAPMTEDERRAATAANYREVMAMAGTDPSKAQLERIAGLEKQQAGDLEQQKGLAALASIPEILKGSNAVRGIGAGAGAFGGMYGKAVQADRAEKRALMSMKNNLEDAQYKTRVGMIGDARQLTAEARRDKQAADVANITKQKALGSLAAQGATLNKPQRPLAAKGSGAAKLPKVNEMLAEAEINFSNNPNEANRKRVEALRNTVDRIRTSDTGSTKATTGAETTESAEMLAGIKAFEDLNKSYNKNSKSIVKQFMDANGGDFTKAAQAYAKTRVTPKAATSGTAAPAPKAAPKSVLPPDTTTGKFVQGKGTEVIKDGKVIGYAN